jgi:2-polyprenyl-3-methyl-5-hydroxy-6-metoxy-1,4-benzoquinol methylase
MKVLNSGGTRIGVFVAGEAGAGARQKLGFQYVLDRGWDAAIVLPVEAGEGEDVLPRLIEPLASRAADVVILSGCRGYAASFLARTPFWDNTDERHFGAQLRLQAIQAGAKVVEVAPPAHGFRDRLSGWRATARYALHRRGILYSRNFDLAVAGRKYFSKFHDPASSHTLIWTWLTALGVADKKVLELGVGDASLTKRLFDAGAVVDGIELDAVAAELARPYCRAIVVDDLDDKRSTHRDERYDLIIAADVLEHLRDPEFVLSQLRELIRPGGRLVVSLPNVANVYVRLNMLLGRFPYHTKGILDRTHLHFYTLKSAEKMFTKAGWTVTDRDVTTIPLVIVFPFLVKPLFRPLMAIFRGMTRLWRGMFAYQGLFYLETDHHELGP